MKKRSVGILAVLAVMALAVCVVAQDKKPLSPPGNASLKFDDGKMVTIDYSRPSMRGRKIFGGLVPDGQVWRAGANAATSMKTDVGLEIGGTMVPAGIYTLYVLPAENDWKLIINKQTGQWGTEYNQGQDLARVPMKLDHLSQPVEMYTISFDKTGAGSAVLKLEWENTSASVKVSEKQ